MNVQRLPLLELFVRLQKAGLPLGIDEYLQVLYALQAGFGVADYNALKRLCYLLWIKTADERRLFNYHFEQLMVETDIPTLPVEAASERSSLPTTSPTLPVATPSEVIVHVEDEVQVAQAMQVTESDYEPHPIYHLLSDEYFPVTHRQMKQAWRYFRCPMRKGPPVELDVEATVNETGRTGILLEPVMVPARVNQAELLFLIDHSGSMTPFHMLSRRMIETVLRGGRLGNASIYYFHNYPTEYLYRDMAHRKYARLQEIVDGGYSQWTGVLVFSDAGAARGNFNQKRVDATKRFLEQLRQQFRYIAWLNPMPRSHWSGTTASVVRKSVPMFDLSRQGLDHAISVLRGQPARIE